MSTSQSNHSRKLVLASSSPRRQRLLREAGFVDFVVEPSHVDEEDFPESILPADVAIHLAKLKANKVASDARYAHHAVLAADTVVALGDRVIGKPDDAMHAREILRLLSGTTQVVVTGVVVQIAAENYLRARRVMSSVKMRSLTEIEIERYLQTGAWRGKAGGYGIQDDHDMVRCTGGCRTNVIGLPLPVTLEMLAEAGIKPA